MICLPGFWQRLRSDHVKVQRKVEASGKSLLAGRYRQEAVEYDLKLRRKQVLDARGKRDMAVLECPEGSVGAKGSKAAGVRTTGRCGAG